MATVLATQPARTADFGIALAELTERVGASVTEVRSNGHGAGAGIIWRADGTIVTNHHVSPRDRAEVRLADGRSFPATVIARDPGNDLAVLKVAVTGLPAAALGNARQLRPGELVLAVGHPFGIRHAATAGVVHAALQRPGWGRRELIAADVRLGPGNSGGPLVNARGRVVGINSMVAGGMALAVPSHLAELLVSGQPAERPLLGIEAQEVELQPALAAHAPMSSGRGVLVMGVTPDGAAERAGLLIGDVLVAIDGQALESSDSLLTGLAQHRGGAIRLSLLRGGVPLEVPVRLDVPTQKAA